MLSLMAKEFFAESPVMMFPIAGLFLFLITFTVLSVKALRRPKDQIEALANLPLESDTGARS